MTESTTVRHRRTRSSSRVEAQNVRPITSKLPTLALLLTALTLIVLGGRMAMAGIASYQAQAFLDSWVTPAEEPSSRAWAVAHEAAQRAVTLYPVENGEYLDRFGLVHSWQQFRQPYGLASAQASRSAALDAYRAAVAARPTWPDSWVRLAHAKLYLLQFDSEFDQALSRAAQLGPWRVGINRELTEIGLAAWPQLDAAQQAAVIESARRTVAYSPTEAKRIHQLAQHTGMIEVLCESLEAELKVNRQICQ